MSDHATYLTEALALAQRGFGRVSPNPLVGAVVVKDGQVAGRGWHKEFGGPHAEIFALQEAGARAKGATLYCTLEPCNHTGKTPPCVNTIVAAGIARVVLGAIDPNPTAAGGARALRAAGIDVVTGICDAECRRLNAPFFKFMRTKLPLVSLKWAMTLDGKIATASGDSKWITSPLARGVGHRLRAEHDAVLIGIGTLLADAPLLNSRDYEHVARQPQRVILDRQARTPLDAPLFNVVDGGRVVIVCASNADAGRQWKLRERGAKVIPIECPGDTLPLKQALIELGRHGLQSILAEGGSRVLGSFLDEQLADRVYAFIAPRLIGGRESIPAIGGKGAAKIAAGVALEEMKVEQVGVDLLVRGRIGSWDWLAGESAP